MTMYLPNPDLHPTGREPGEFIAAEFIAAEFIDAHRAGQPGDMRSLRPSNVIATNRKATS
jgi:hypothetical protein